MSDTITREAFWLESRSGPLAARLHLPSADTLRHGGAVICPPRGYEYVHSYRTLLHLADRLAVEGIPALRFDYRGCGASAGDELEANLVDSWIESIRAAAAFMEDMCGAPASLVGLRLGATLAAVASSRFDVDHLVAWAPIAKGRRYAREERALAEMATDGSSEQEGLIESGGFILTDATAADLGTIDLSGLDYRIRGQALVLERDDLSARPVLAERLRSSGIETGVVEASGYLEMMDEPHATVVPEAALDSIVSWLSERVSETRCERVGTAPRRNVLHTTIGGQPVTQELAEIPGPPSLFGVLTAPEPATGSEAPPVLLLANSGSVHQVGPNRLYVEISRRLAEAGVATLRVDLRNLGDSIAEATAEENHPYPATAVEDVARAVRWLREERGIENVVVGGLCSGAHTAFHGGLQLTEPRIDGVIMINPLTFYWADGMSLDTPTYRVIMEARAYTKAIRDPRRWLRLLRRRSDIAYALPLVARRLRDVLVSAAVRVLEQLRLRPLQPLSRDLLRYEETARHIDLVFSMGDPGHALLTDAARATARRLERRGALTVGFIDGADHTFSHRRYRDAVATAIVERMRRYGSAPSESAR